MYGGGGGHVRSAGGAEGGSGGGKVGAGGARGGFGGGDGSMRRNVCCSALPSGHKSTVEAFSGHKSTAEAFFVQKEKPAW
eukprot:scaffold81097_cov66-Phaeocystis_antarctica.AAC.4